MKNKYHNFYPECKYFWNEGILLGLAQIETEKYDGHRTEI